VFVFIAISIDHFTYRLIKPIKYDVVFVFIAISIDHFTLRLIKQVKKFIVIKGPFFYSNISLLLSLLLFLFYSFMMDMEKIAKDKL
jgi:hypothetical protein